MAKAPAPPRPSPPPPTTGEVPYVSFFGSGKSQLKRAPPIERTKYKELFRFKFFGKTIAIEWCWW